MTLEARPSTRSIEQGWNAYLLRWKRRRLLWRSWRSRHHLSAVSDRTNLIEPGDILAVTVLRNEIGRLPYFLSHHRRLGVAQFLVVDNDSNDGSTEFLSAQSDVSLWRTSRSYHASRFGLDWLTWLQMTYAHDHWCLMVDADEALIYAHHVQRSLTELTQWLDSQKRTAFGALMLDLYPKGPLNEPQYTPGQNPTEVLQWFDPGPYRAIRQQPLGNLWVQGGARERIFFEDDPKRSPTLNKLPLVRWNRRYAYVNSAHSILPPAMNATYDGPGGGQPSGILLHSKFLPEIVSKSATEKQRQQHFHTPQDFDGYYDHLGRAPDLWHDNSVRFVDWQQLEHLRLMCSAGW